jgi:hypothetical protein
MKQVTEAATTDPAWKSLYKVGGAATLIMIAITLTQVVVFAFSPPPYKGTAVDWFTRFQNNALLGLLDFEVLLVVYVGLSTLVSLALFVALRRTSPTLTAIFLVLSLIGSAAFIFARPAFEMLSLSNQYAAATTDAQRAAFLAAGEAMLAVFRGTAYLASYLLGSITGLIIAAVMLRTSIFGRGIPYLRIASSVFDFGIFVPTVGLFISLFSVVCLLLFNILIARRLIQLGSGVSKEGSY